MRIDMRALHRIGLGMLAGLIVCSASAQQIEYRPGGYARAPIAQDVEPGGTFGGVSKRQISPETRGEPQSAVPADSRGADAQAESSLAGAKSVAAASEVIRIEVTGGAPLWSKILFGIGAGLALLITGRVLMDRFVPVQPVSAVRAKREA